MSIILLTGSIGSEAEKGKYCNYLLWISRIAFQNKCNIYSKGKLNNWWKFQLLACDSSFDCDDKAFCVSDGGNDGTCESCSSLGDKKCKDSGYVDKTDEEECESECEG